MAEQMKRRGFLALLGMAPAVPLLAKELAKPAGGAPKQSIEGWTLQPLDSLRQPWLGQDAVDAQCVQVEDGVVELTAVMQYRRKEWDGQRMPAFVRATFMGAACITPTHDSRFMTPMDTLSIVQRIKIG